MLKKYIKNKKWFLFALFGVLLSAPNATIIRYASDYLDPFQFTAFRFGILTLITVPFIWRARKLLTSQAVRYSVMAALFMATAIICYVSAIHVSTAIYPTIITLLTPLVFIVYSVWFTHEKINRHALTGITLAALGALVIVGVPVAFHQQGAFTFYPLATILALINVATFPLAVIFSRKANEAGLPLTAVIGISAPIIFIINTAILLVQGGGMPSDLPVLAVLAVLYSGVMVAFVARMINVFSYEKLGSVVESSLTYAELFVAISLPIIILGELLSIELVIGGLLILMGVYLAEHHPGLGHRHYHALKRH